MSFRNVQVSYEYIWSLPHEMEAPIATFGLTEYKIQRFRAVERFCPDLVLMKKYRANHKYERKKTSDRRRVKNIWTNNILWSAFSILWKARVQFSHNLSIIRIRELLKDFQQCLLSPEGGCKHEETPIAHSANQTKPRIWQKKKVLLLLGVGLCTGVWDVWNVANYSVYRLLTTKKTVCLLMIEHIETNHVSSFIFARGYMIHLESTCHVSHVTCKVSHVTF